MNAQPNTVRLFAADRSKQPHELDRLMGRDGHHPALRYSSDYTPEATASIRETFLALGGKIVEGQG